MRVGLVCLLSLGLVCFGCGDDDGPTLGDGGGEDATTGDGGGEDATTGDGGGDDGGGDDGGGDDAATDDAATDDAATDDAGPGACRDNSMCEDGEYCAASGTGSIAVCDAPGTCQVRPEGCPDVVDPVCGCDGVDYVNGCEANAVGVRVAAEGRCPSTECEMRAPDSCCFTDAECADRGVCRSAVCVEGGAGTCVAPPEDGECWVTSDCAEGQRCRGAVQCPCGAACIVPDMPGRCVGLGDGT